MVLTWTIERTGLSEEVRVDRLGEELDEMMARIMLREKREKPTASAAT